MDRMKQAGMTDVVSFNTLIKAHLQNGSFDKVRRLMEMMTSEGLKPNQVTFNELLNSMASKGGDGRRKQMWGIVDEMKLAGVKPNQVTISILLKCLNSYSSQTDIATTMDLIKSMDDTMDEVLLSSVVEACVRICQPDLLEKQLKHLGDSAPININGSHTYGSLIKAYGHAKDLTSIWRCWKEMRSRHITPTCITMGCMIDAIVNNGDTEGAYDLIHQMQEDEQCRDVVNSVIYCSILKGFTRERKIDRVWTVYKEMKDQKAELSVVTYNTLIDACARCGRMEHLSTILEDMKTHGAKPNVITYSTMLKGHCQNGDVQSGFQILEQIKKDPCLKPDEIMYNSLLDGCAQNNLVDEGLRLLEEMQGQQVWPSNYTLSILVKLLSRARRLDQAFSLVEEICQKYKFRPNVHVYTNLVQACVFNQQLPRGISVLEQMVGEWIAPDGRTYAILLRGSMNKGLFEQAAGLLMGALGLPDAPSFLQQSVALCPSLDYALINEVLGGLADRGHAKDLAVPLLQSMRQNAPKVRIDPATQRKVMSPCVGSDSSGARPWSKSR
jgi:pentatricopeptide repeat protein